MMHSHANWPRYIEMRKLPLTAVASAIAAVLVFAPAVAAQQSKIDRATNSLQLNEGATVVLYGGEVQGSMLLRGASAGVGNKGSVLGSVVAEGGSTIGDGNNSVELGRNSSIIGGDNSIVGAIVARSDSMIGRATNSLQVDEGASLVLYGGEVQGSLLLRGASAGVGTQGSILGSVVAEGGSTIGTVTNITRIGRNARIVAGDGSIVGAIVAR